MDEDDETRVSLAKDGRPGALAGAHGAPFPEQGPAGGATALPAPERPDGETPLDAVVAGAAYAVLALLGALFGVFGSFVQNWTFGPVPVAAIALVVLVFCIVRLAGLGMGGRLGAAVPAVMWGVMAFVMSLRRAEGDLAVPGTTAGYVYIIGGMVAAVAGVMLVPAARPQGEWLLGRAARPRG
ncbi:DUF6113 family protein [Actinomadura livida]|uniref:Integral membrane protein n=1 Tax=Actinomadura livida TaxID=79909 RepID=A0A7W7IAD0_9ACTN|nr:MULTISPECIES: DUF6113 family protein [Actinomadura]MBB4773340.1 hypothetical protein [Actinomadura catellatispora]GGU33526.1 hypothetical protein GCM10010208_67720 [Actinomadura livida]